PAGVPAGDRGLCGGHRLRLVLPHPAPHPRPVLGGQPRGALQLVIGDVAIEPEAPRRRSLPFSPWHLVLFPLAVIMLAPLLWMLVTALERSPETQPFPPILIPHALHWQNYPDALRAAPFGRWFLNTTIVTTVVVVGNLFLCSLAGYAFARIRFLGRQVA